MKRVYWLFRILLPIILICIFYFSSISASVKLCSVNFDNQEIEFYYNSSLGTNDGFYFQIKGQSQKYLRNDVIDSKDHSVFFYVLYGEYQKVIYNGTKILPAQVIPINIDDKSKNINIYILDSSKEYALVPAAEEKGYIFKSEKTIFKNGIICSEKEFSDTNHLLKSINLWSKLSTSEVTMDEMETFLIISENWTNINTLKGPNDWVFTRCNYDDKGWIICVDDGNKSFYHLNDEEMKQLEQELINMFCHLNE